MRRSRHDIRVISLIRSIESWAHVARQLSLALMRLGVRVGIEEHAERPADLDYQLPQALHECIDPDIDADVDLAIVEPTEFGTVCRSRRRFALMVWESSAWPVSWVAAARRELHGVLVPSMFCARSLAAAGLPAWMITTVPHGVDSSVFHARGRAPAGTRRRREILFVGTPAKRKGFDLLLTAFPRAFEPKGAPRLVLKTEDWPDRVDGYVRWRADVSALAAAGYDVHVITASLSDPQMASLYSHADLLVLPHRGEGFGLPLIEAMACGTPVLSTAWSGPLDFVDESVGFQLTEFEERAARDLFPVRFEAPSDAVMVEPDLDALITTLRRVMATPEALAAKGRAAAQRAALLTWHHSAFKTAAALGVKPSEHGRSRDLAR